MFEWLKRKTQPVASPPITTSKPIQSDNFTTRIDKSDFAIDLPSSWSEVAREDGFEFQNNTLPEQLIVNVLHTRRSITIDEMRLAVAKLVEVRRNAIQELSNAGAQLTDTVFREANGQVEARFNGRDEANGVQIATTIRATPNKTITAALYRYMLGDVGLPFSDYAALIFDLAKLNGA